MVQTDRSLEFTFEGHGEVPFYKGVRIFYWWPGGPWRDGYKINIKKVTDYRVSVEVDTEITWNMSVDAGGVTVIKPVWWRRLLKPVYFRIRGWQVG